MYRTEVLNKRKGFDDLNGFIDAYPDLVFDAFETAFNRNAPKLQHELDFTPGQPKYPIQWTSDRQRKAFFASNGFGRGIPAPRTGKLNKSWKLALVRRGDEAVLTVTNTAKYAAYVVGRVRPRGKDPMQRMHKVTGWQPVAPTFEFWADAIRDDAITELRKYQPGGKR